jgi:hypothetical protein
MVKYSTCLLFMFFSIVLLLLFFSTILLLPPTFVCGHSSALPLPLLFSIVFQLHSLHSCCYELQNLKMCTTSNNKHKLLSIITLFFSFLKCPTHHIHFFPTRHLLINAWSLKLIWPIIISLCDPWQIIFKSLHPKSFTFVVNTQKFSNHL